jgi:hypothetical protein
MDLDSRTARLCLEGTQAEFERRLDDARRLFLAAWEARADDYDAGMAAHYVAHLEPEPHEALRWNLLALEHAQRDSRSAEFMGSLLVSLGGACEATGDAVEAQRHFELASQYGVQHSGARELTTIVAVGNCGRGPCGPCGRDRQVLFDYLPNIRVIMPTPEGIRSVHIQDLLPLGTTRDDSE